MSHNHHGGATATATGLRRFALVGSPNSGKTTLFNALTGLRAKTGNYPGVTVSRYEGVTKLPDGDKAAVEDLPGAYSLDPISPDEDIVAQVLDRDHHHVPTPDALLVTLDATSLQRSLGFLAHVLQAGLPVCVVLTFADEHARRRGSVDAQALERALGVTVVTVTAGRPDELAVLRDAMTRVGEWPAPVVPPPTDPEQVTAWIRSVLQRAEYTAAGTDTRTNRADAVLLHPVWGTLIFFVTMFVFFQTVFTVAAPLQGWVEEGFAWLGELARESIPIGWLSSFVADALIGGVGGVLVFIPQIALLFILIALLEGSGYMSRAAFLMDRVMASAGLEGRAFVALLSSVACAIPGIMATRSLPSAKDRIATMMGAPLMTCAARLPVYVLLIGMLVPADLRWGPIGLQGTIMFGLYLLGAVAAMTAAWVTKRLTGRRGVRMPFYMEMPSYRMPRLRSVVTSVWDACKAFLRKVSTIILLTTVVLWVALNLPLQSTTSMEAAGVDTSDDAAVSSYVLEHSYAASAGKAVEPVFEPLGFDWRVNIAVISTFAAREVFVATLGQIAAASDPEDPAGALEQMTVDHGPNAGQPLFTPGTIAALMIFFAFALQCMSTIGTMRRETGTWKWPVIAWTSYFAAAWVFAFLTKNLVELFL
ncbi:ferrous iron transporter B [Propionicicella superfundia]|uniref:ferrous iron transporter B n=1 Tax=Propionicicella superfundia TaxID=348582 RepID=UPI00041DF0C5|nr:ferrous iron transporter B [Propionicicella superfundia]